MNGFFGYGCKGHKIRDFPNLKSKWKVVNQARHGGPNHNSPKRNYFYALESK